MPSVVRSMHQFSSASPKSLALTVLRSVGLLTAPDSSFVGGSVARLVRTAVAPLRDENLRIIRASEILI